MKATDSKTENSKKVITKSLPNDVLDHAFSFLSIKTIPRVALVSKNWAAIIANEKLQSLICYNSIPSRFRGDFNAFMIIRKIQSTKEAYLTHRREEKAVREQLYSEMAQENEINCRIL